VARRLARDLGLPLEATISEGPQLGQLDLPILGRVPDHVGTKWTRLVLGEEHRAGSPGRARLVEPLEPRE
jgi:hypothetical protein